ncbi:MAG: NYN domain-containing protein [Bacteroidia bacterium]|nr:NYN domain-containing protein [Bacteroidia bacterium]
MLIPIRILVVYDGGFHNAANSCLGKGRYVDFDKFHSFLIENISNKILGSSASSISPFLNSPLLLVDKIWFEGPLSSRGDSRESFYVALRLSGIREIYSPYFGQSERGVTEKAVDVWVALETYETALTTQAHIVVLVTGDADFIPLVRKLKARGVLTVGIKWKNCSKAQLNERLEKELWYVIDMDENMDKFVVSSSK